MKYVMNECFAQWKFGWWRTFCFKEAKVIDAVIPLYSDWTFQAHFGFADNDRNGWAQWLLVPAIGGSNPEFDVYKIIKSTWINTST